VIKADPRAFEKTSPTSMPAPTTTNL